MEFEKIIKRTAIFILMMSLFLDNGCIAVLAESENIENTANGDYAKEGNDSFSAETVAEYSDIVEDEVGAEEKEATDENDQKNADKGVSDDEITNETASVSELHNPVHHCDRENGGMNDYTDYSYIYFGSYPQSKVTDRATIMKIDGALSAIGKKTGDIWVDGIKYRKMDEIEKRPVDTAYGFEKMEESHKYVYFKWERIKWKILRITGNKAFLMAVNGIDARKAQKNIEKSWESSEIRKWLNGREGYWECVRSFDNDSTRLDFWTATDFYSTAFSVDERKAIISTILENNSNIEYGITGNKTTDKIFLLSLDEVTNPEYGFCGDGCIYIENDDELEGYYEDGCNSSTRWVGATDYCLEREVYVNDRADREKAVVWCLRSPSKYSSDYTCVETDGSIDPEGSYTTRFAVVPALYIDLSSSQWMIADDGMSGTGGGEILEFTNSFVVEGSSSAQAFSKKTISGVIHISKNIKGAEKILKEFSGGIKWTSSDESIVPVWDISCKSENSADNRSSTLTISFTPLKEGNVIITGTTANGLQASCVVTVGKAIGSPVISKVKKAKKSFKATWKKVNGIDGYELQYSTDKQFKSKKVTKTKTISASKKSITVKKLKSGKKYYIRIRAYKKVDGKKEYSEWSKVKSVKVK